MYPAGHWQLKRPESSARQVPLWQGEEAHADSAPGAAQRHAPPCSTHSCAHTSAVYELRAHYYKK